jgi:hypothetical protein
VSSEHVQHLMKHMCCLHPNVGLLPGMGQEMATPLVMPTTGWVIGDTEPKLNRYILTA